MPYFADSEQLNACLKLLFSRIEENDPSAGESVSKSRLLMRLRLTSPLAVVTFNGRQTPLQILYINSNLRPDIELEMPADLLYQILLSEISLKKAVATGKMRVRGPFTKAFAFENIFRSGQALFPNVLEELGLRENRKQAN